MRIAPETRGVSIGLVGNSNPAMFTPAWFALHNLTPSELAEGVRLGVAYVQHSGFSENWLSISLGIV